MEPRQESEPGFVVKNSEYVFPLEKKGKTIDRHVLVFPTYQKLISIFGENPKEKLRELIKDSSDTEIAERFSTDELQLSTFSVIFARRGLKLGQNENKSKKGKVSEERVGVAIELEKSDEVKNLTPKEQAALVLGFLISAHTPTTKEMTRLLGFTREDDTSRFLSELFNKISKTRKDGVK